MQNKSADPFHEKRKKTDKSLEEERHKTDGFIDDKSKTIEDKLDQKTQSNRLEADKIRESDRSEIKLSAGDEVLIQERERADKAQKLARQYEDQIREKERFQKRLAAESLLGTERKDTDINLLDERIRTDEVSENEKASHDLTKIALMTRDQFVSIVSHDLRSPVGAISMSADLIQEALSEKEFDKEKICKFLEIISRNAENMDRMISDLLDVERMSNNKLDIHVELLNVSALLKECNNLFAPIALNKSLSIVVEQSTEQLIVSADHDRILQVLSNLIGNALKFTPQGGVITLSARNRNNEVEISVADNGAGIADEKKLKVFERFSQLKTNDRRGLGLGLFISKWIVEAHDGQIYVTSEVGKGSVFSFTLPQL